MKKIAFLIPVLFSSLLRAQDPVSFKDEFNDNSSSWSLSEDAEKLQRVSNGKYLFENKTDGAFWAHKSLFLDPSKDFSFEAEFTQVNGDNNSGYGLVTGLDAGKNYLIFLITSTKYFNIYEYKNGEHKELKAWTISESVKPMGEKNKLMEKRIGNKIFFYINDTEVFSAPYTRFVGTYHGFYLSKKKLVEIDNFIVRQDVPTTINLVKDLKTGYKKENLGANVNSVNADKMPVISPDGKTIFISRAGDEVKKDEIWISEQENDSTFRPAKNAGFPLNNNGHNFVISITPDNNTMLLGNTYAADGGVGSSGFSITRRTESGWTIPSTIQMKNFNNKHAYTSSSLANNREIMILSAELGQTYGGSDLYVSFLEKDGTWSEPKNLGTTINTFGEEFTPFISADGTTLYYSTNGKRGYGDNDIFLSRRLDSTWVHWSEPENLGPDINTDEWDAYFTLPASGNYAYVASTKNTIGLLDIFKIKLPTAMKPRPVVLIYGKVLNSKTRAPIGTEIQYFDLKTGKEVGAASSNPKDGSYKIILPAGITYSFLASKKDFVSISDNIDLSKLTEYKEIQRDLYLAPIEVGQTIRLNNIFFDFAKDNLLPTSFADLDRLIHTLTEYPGMQIEVAGHTDNVGSDDANQKLSQARAASVVSYLLSKGIQSTRLVSKGFGESKPVSGNDTDEGRALNRRVEFTILKK